MRVARCRALASGRGDVHASVDSSAAEPDVRKAREVKVFLFLTVVLAPVLAVAFVGAYGFAVWIYQMFVGPPTG